MPLLNTDGTSLIDATRYKVYYGVSPTSLTNSVIVTGGSVTSTTINGLTGGTYYFAVATLNSAGIESDLSGVASKTVP